MGQLYEITPFSLLDYPGEMACIAWFAGCNMRCIFCHNPQIVTGKGSREEEELLSFLEKRRGRLTAVVFSGGEATLYDGLPDLVRRVKAMGFKVKLDTNGTRPALLRDMLAENSLDYIAMDYKCPLELAKELIGTEKHWAPFRESLGLLIDHAKRNPAMTLEVRTTVYAKSMGVHEINNIIMDLEQMGYKGTYYIQNVFAFGDKTIGHIDEPEHVLDRNLLIEPKSFALAFRNFSDES